MAVDELAKQLFDANLTNTKAAVSTLANGWHVRSVGKPVKCSKLRAIYELRVQHLAKISSAHAAQLLSAAREMLIGLQNQVEEFCEWIVIAGGDECEFLVLRFYSSQKVIGCLKAVSKSDVSEERWHELWADEA